MATVRWTPGVAPTTEVWTLTVGGTIESDDRFIITLGSKSINVAAGNTAAATVATNIVAAINALDDNDYPEFAQATWTTTSGGSFTATSTEPGRPFTPSVSTTESGGGAADAQTFTATQTTAATGPNHWDAAGNWSGGAVPVNGDDVVIEHSSVSIKYGLAQSAVTLASLTIRQSYTGDIGLPEVNSDGTEYHEYRATYLAIGATVATLGEGEGQGSGRIKLNFGTAPTALTVYNTGSPAETDLETVQWKGTHAANVVNADGGSAAIAGYGGETATVATLRIGEGATCRLGSGVSLATVTNAGGELDLASNTTTLTCLGGTTTVRGSATGATVVVDAGTLEWLSSGTVGTAFSVGSGATVDYSGDLRSKTITPVIQLYAGATWRDPNAVVTYTAGMRLNRCGVDEVDIDVGQNRTITVA